MPEGKFSSEAIKKGLIPPDDLTYQELRNWINENCDPDEMGFDGEEGSV
jgi:hypothetical protein